jgi:hypothetical protein
MNPQNDPARIRAKKALHSLFSISLGPNLYKVLDDLVDDLIDAAVNQVHSEMIDELSKNVDAGPFDEAPNA